MLPYHSLPTVSAHNRPGQEPVSYTHLDMYVVIAAFLLIFVSVFIYKEDSDFDFLNPKKGGTHE